MPTKNTKETDAAEEHGRVVGEKTAGVASLMVFGKFVALFLAGIAFIVVARILGPSLYGVYTISYSFAGFFGAGFSDLGIGTAFSKFVGQYWGKGDKESTEKVLSNGYVVAIISGLVFTIIAFMLSGFFAVHILKDSSLIYIVQIVAFTIIGAQLFSISYNALVGFGKGSYIALVIILQSIVQAASSIILAVLGYGAVAPIMGLLLGYIVSIVSTLTIMYFKFKIRFIMPSLKYMKQLLTFSYPISVYNGLRGIITNLSPIILALFATTVIVGNFGVAVKTSAIITNITDALGVAVLPMFAYTVATKSIGKNLSRFYNSAAYLTFIIITPVLLYLAVLSKQFSFTVFSARYLYAPLYISVISVGTLLWVIATYTTMLLVGGNEVKKILKYSIMIVIIELILLFTIVPRFGGFGLTIVLYGVTPTIISLVMGRATNMLLDVKLDVMKLSRVVIAGAISAAFLAPIIFLISTHYILILAIGAVEQLVIYPIIIGLTGAAKKDDLSTLRTVTRNIPVVNGMISMLASYSSYFAHS